MKLEVNINKRFAWAILGVLIILTGILAVNAIGTNDPQTFGHSASEISNAPVGFIEGRYDFAESIALGGWGNNVPGVLQLRGGQGDVKVLHAAPC